MLTKLLLVISSHLKTRLGVGALGNNVDAADFSVGSMVSHLLLVHNWNAHWCFAIIGVLWSVAVEWQIYFLLPLLLLPLWKRFFAKGTGFASAIIIFAGLAIGSISIFLPGHYLTWCRPWYIGLFAMGMIGAAIREGRDASANRLQKLPWGVITAVAVVAIVVIRRLDLANLAEVSRLIVSGPILDILIGVAALGAILSFAEHASGGNHVVAFLRKSLETRVALAVGTISYSLYLTHFLWIGRIITVLSKISHLTAIQYGVLLVLLTLLVSLVVAYLFYRLFEKPFINLRRKTGSVALKDPEVYVTPREGAT